MNSNDLESKFLAISEVLYKKDPAQTCCVENNLFDEYDSEACAIVEIFAEKNAITVDQIKNLFNERFDGFYSEEVIENSWPTIKRILNT